MIGLTKSVVIGGGVIGLLSAYELRRRGRDVVVLDKGELRRGASSGNAGWVTPSLSAPVPQPGIVGDSLRWMLQPESPLYVSPLAVPKMAGWLFSFWRHCSEKHFERGLAALSKFNSTTMADFDALKENGLRFEMHRLGLMYVFHQESAAAALQRELEASSKYAPIEWERLSAGEARELEPLLRPELAGAINISSDRHVRPESLLTGAYEWLLENGVELRPHAEVVDFVIDGGRVTGVRLADGVVEADEVLIATGAEAGRLARRAGLNLPMQAGKGYSTTIEMDEPPIGRSMYLAESRVALAPYEGALRIAGTMELSGINLTMHERRIDAMIRNANRYLTGLGEGRVVERWVGMRPMLPDGLPAIGRTPALPNVYVASGHAMLGVTLGPTTAAAVAGLMVEGKSPYDISAFSPTRFQRGAGETPERAPGSVSAG